MKIRRSSSRQQQSDNVQRTFLIVSHQMCTFCRIQIGSNVLKATSPNGRVEENQSSRSRIVGEVEDVAFDEDLKILEFVELEHPELE